MHYYRLWQLIQYMNPETHDGIGNNGNIGSFLWRIFAIALAAGIAVSGTIAGLAYISIWLVENYG